MFWISSVLPTEVPPNFLTIIAITFHLILIGNDLSRLFLGAWPVIRDDNGKDGRWMVLDPGSTLLRKLRDLLDEVRFFFPWWNELIPVSAFLHGPYFGFCCYSG
jgi:hypothetical protein